LSEILSRVCTTFKAASRISSSLVSQQTIQFCHLVSFPFSFLYLQQLNHKWHFSSMAGCSNVPIVSFFSGGLCRLWLKWPIIWRAWVPTRSFLDFNRQWTLWSLLSKVLYNSESSLIELSVAGHCLPRSL
jgi:hypothetical protein